MGIMVFQPTLCSRFRCKADQCRYNCCQGWDIPLTEGDSIRIKRSGENREPFMARTGEAAFPLKIALSNHTCPFLDGRHLCRLQLESGKRNLPGICTDFPMVYYQVSNVLEGACSPGCEEILWMLLQEKDGISFENAEIDGACGERASFHFDADAEKRRPVLTLYWDIKSLCLSILMERTMPMDGRIRLLAQVMAQLQIYEAEGRLSELAAFLEGCMEDLESGNLSAPPAENRAPNLLHILHTAYACCLPDTQKPWHTEIFHRLGVDPAHGTVNWEQYGAAITVRDAFLRNNESFLENLCVCFFHQLAMPFGDGSFSIWQNCLWFCSLYASLKFALAGALHENMEEAIHRDKFFQTISAFSRGFVHGTMRRNMALENLAALELNTLSGLDALVQE